ncbi:MAG TPA: hypothetical protein VEI97_05120, partial [bacterium]|nr:hypothetical protein [bacterium]
MLLSLRPAIAGATLAVTTLLGCSGNPATGPAGTPAHSPVSAAGHQGLVQGIGGLWILEVQPDPLAVRLTPARASQTVQQQFLYHLDIEQ